MKATPASDLELYEIIVAAYPDRFDADSEDDNFDAVMEFISENFGDLDCIADLMGRVVYLAPTMQSPISQSVHHVLGKLRRRGNNIIMDAAIKRPYQGDPDG